tara:strand:- start:102 stop:764 length:663 start_codon:yes stop_codon:yes gene_type:complete
MNSHGFLTKSVEKKEIALIRQKVSIFLKSESQKSNYYKNISEKIDNLNDLINPVLFDKVNNLLANSNPELSQIELHVQEAGCPGIPPHQDNFYHHIDPLDGLKVLIPLQSMDKSQGALIFLDNEVNSPVLEHCSSEFANFSSFINKNIIDSLKFTTTSYCYLEGDCSYHFMNSIHFSEGNNTNLDFYFLVYRFQKPNSKTDLNLRSKYEKCYENHLKRLK